MSLCHFSKWERRKHQNPNLMQFSMFSMKENIFGGKSRSALSKKDVSGIFCYVVLAHPPPSLKPKAWGDSS